MKRILFKKLSLLNFCGTRQAEYEFGDNITTISGGNGLGKSTISNAIAYCLFGKNAKGLAMDIKTFGQNHNIIREIPHEVTLVLSVDGEPIELKRTLTDSWKGESVSNTYKYFVNGDVVTAGDFKKAVDGICQETAFRLCSSATDFVSRPWADQRKLLEELVSNITPDAITQGEPKYDFVLEALKKETIDKVIHHLKYQRKEVQEALDKVPVRLTELKKALPERYDWEELQTEKEKLDSQLSSLGDKILTIRSGGAESVRVEGIHRKIEFAEKRKFTMERSAADAAARSAEKHESDVISSTVAYTKAKSTVEELQVQMSSYTETEIHANQQKEDCEMKVKDFNAQMNEISSRTWRWNDKDSFCPHCLQPLPVDRLKELKQESLNRFNEQIAEDKKKLQENFASLQKTYTEIKGILEQIDEDRRMTTNQLVKAQQALKQAAEYKAQVDSESALSKEQILGSKEEYKAVLTELAQLQDELNDGSVSAEDADNELKALEEQRADITAEYNNVLSRIASKENYDSIVSLISKAKADKLTYQEQLDALDEKIDIAGEYYTKSCTILEESVNDKFSYVKWSLFQTTQNGERKPFCECYHDGVAYSSLNGAAKVNAGIDIANAFSSFCDVSVPMILDECESNLHPIYNGGQQIRLCVAPTDKLVFSYSDGSQD